MYQGKRSVQRQERICEVKRTGFRIKRRIENNVLSTSAGLLVDENANEQRELLTILILVRGAHRSCIGIDEIAMIVVVETGDVLNYHPWKHRLSLRSAKQ